MLDLTLEVTTGLLHPTLEEDGAKLPSDAAVSVSEEAPKNPAAHDHVYEAAPGATGRTVVFGYDGSLKAPSSITSAADKLQL